MFNLTPVVKNLLIINILFLVLEQFFKIPLSALLGYHSILGDSFQPYQFITYMFVHADFFHLFSNMFALIIFGPLLEQFLGQKRFLLFYLITGVGAGLLYAGVNFWEVYQIKLFLQDFALAPSPEKLTHFASQFNLTYEGLNFIHEIYPENAESITYQKEAISLVTNIFRTMSNSGMVGASGAVFGILMGFALLFPNLRLILLFPPIPIRAKFLVIFYAAYEIYELIQRNPNDNVAHLAHLGGMLFAFILYKLWKLQRPNIEF